MVYGRAYPRIDNIRWLRALARPYPVTASEVLEIAKRWHFSTGTIDFISLFPSDLIFMDEADFVRKCQEVELFIESDQSLADLRTV